MNYNFNGDILKNGEPVGGGGVYLHKISYGGSAKYYFFSSQSEPFTEATLSAWLISNGYNKKTKYFPVYLHEFSKVSNFVLEHTVGIFSASTGEVSEVEQRITLDTTNGFSLETSNWYGRRFETDTVVEL